MGGNKLLNVHSSDKRMDSSCLGVQEIPFKFPAVFPALVPNDKSSFLIFLMPSCIQPAVCSAGPSVIVS